MARFVFEGKILTDQVLDNIQYRDDGNSQFEVISTFYNGDVVVLKVCTTEDDAQQFIAKIADAAVKSEHVDDIVVIDTPEIKTN